MFVLFFLNVNKSVETFILVVMNFSKVAINYAKQVQALLIEVGKKIMSMVRLEIKNSLEGQGHEQLSYTLHFEKKLEFSYVVNQLFVALQTLQYCSSK